MKFFVVVIWGGVKGDEFILVGGGEVDFFS